MPSKFVLIDFENVQPASFDTLSADENLRVVVFVGATQTRLPFEFVDMIQRLGDKAEYIKILSSGLNSLDFHIAFYLGKLAGQNPNACFLIISKDTGYDPLIEHLKTKKIRVSRASSLDSRPKLTSEACSSIEDRVELYIARLQDPKFPRPRSEITLSRSLATFLGNQLSEKELSIHLTSIKNRGILRVIDGKISYPNINRCS